MPLLEISNISKLFGGLTALDDISTNVERGEMVGVIGPNGAGKTTFFNVISGFLASTKGRVIFEGRDITGHRPDKLAEKGLIRTFQLTALFDNMSVVDNVVIGHNIRSRIGSWGSLFGTSFTKRKERADLEQAMEILEFMDLTDLRNEAAKNLSHGHQKRLGIALALAADPKLFLIDEGTSGMSFKEAAFVMNRLSQIRERGTSVLLVEHNMRVIMDYCDRIIVLNFGRKIAEGLPKEIQQNNKVIEAYLGRE